MVIRVIVVGLLVVGLCGPVWAFDPMEDLHVATGAAPSSGVRTPQDVLNDIAAVLDALHRDMGGAYVLEIDPRDDSAADTQWQQRFETANHELSALWKEFSAAVDGDRDRRVLDRDEAFRAAVAEAYAEYRGHFGVLENDPTRMYEQLYDQASQNRYTLSRRRRLLFNPRNVSLSSGVSRIRGTNPTQWSSSDLVYALGLMPRELLDDVNMSIRVAYHMGYLRQKDHYNLSDPAFSRFIGFDWGRVTYTTSFNDDFYYRHIHGAPYLVSMLSGTFRTSQPHTASTEEIGGAIERALAPAREALQRADTFRESHQELTTTRRGEMFLDRDVPDETADPIREEYQKICEDFQAAMNDFRRHLDEFRSTFPGDATVVFHDALRKAFEEYRRDFLYGDVDQLALRFNELRDRTGRFSLNRRGLLSRNRSLTRPSAWSAPRKELYSAQRVVQLLPPDFLNEVNRRRQAAFRDGESAATREYQRQQPSPSSGGSDWNDPEPSSGGSSWNDPEPSSGGSSWNDPEPSSGGW